MLELGFGCACCLKLLGVGKVGLAIVACTGPGGHVATFSSMGAFASIFTAFGGVGVKGAVDMDLYALGGGVTHGDAGLGGHEGGWCGAFFGRPTRSFLAGWSSGSVLVGVAVGVTNPVLPFTTTKEGVA